MKVFKELIRTYILYVNIVQYLDKKTVAFIEGDGISTSHGRPLAVQK
jgi:hypothetical protein